jgi:hypothetical protein
VVGEERTVRGTVREFTNAPRGEVDGFVLDDGTVVHWPPHLQDRFTAIVAKGDRVKATGWMETPPAGDTHLEVQTLTNLRTGASRDNDAGPRQPLLGRGAGQNDPATVSIACETWRINSTKSAGRSSDSVASAEVCGTLRC